MNYLLFFALMVSVLSCKPAQQPGQTNPSPNSVAAPASVPGAESPVVVAKVGDKTLSGAELDEMIKPRLAKIQGEIYKIKRQAVNEWMSNALLEDEAKKRGTTLDKLLEETTSKLEVSDAEAKGFYEQNKSRFNNQPYEKVQDRIKAQLSGKKRQEAVQALLADLRKGAATEVYLEQPRAEVSVDDDPAQGGDKDAPIVLIEFSDFQCPFCKRARPTIDQILSTYGKKVHYVFRDFPLSFHKDSMLAHQAANCAGEQDKYWDYNKGLWDRQQQLERESLVSLAKSLGLNESKFNECLDSGKQAEEVSKDIADGQKSGVSGTPAYFINGRFLSGAQPFEAFKEIIDEELAAKK